MCNKEKYYITTAIAYTSRKPHIGNTYEIVLTDAIARFKRYMGYDVFFCTGTDEHGQKIQQIAEELSFSDQSSFGKFFKRHSGVSPLKYRQQLKKTLLTLRQ